MGLEKIDANHLSPRALALVSEFALVLYRLNKTIINVDSDDVLIAVAENAQVNNDLYLRDVYFRLREELRKNAAARVSKERAQDIHDLLASHARKRVSIGYLQ